MNTLKNYTFSTKWSAEDQQYAGLCDQFPSLSWLHPNETEALAGIKRLVKEISKDMEEQNE